MLEEDVVLPTISPSLRALLGPEEAAGLDRIETAMRRAEDAARRAEFLGDRDLFMPGFGVLAAEDLAVAMRARARRLAAVMRAEMDRVITRPAEAAEAAVAAVAAVGAPEPVVEEGDDNGAADDASVEPARPRRGRPPKPREV